MVDARNKTHMENEELGWTIAGETGVGYGAFGGGNDVHNIDLKKRPRWADVPWYDAPLEAGDCIFIPTSWYHQVRTPQHRSIALNIWWWRRDGPYSAEELELWDSCPYRNTRTTIADCQFGYEGPPDNPRQAFDTRRLSRCKGIDSPSKRGKEALSFITRWQRFAERRLFAELKRRGVDEFTAPIELQVSIAEAFHERMLGRKPRNEL